MPSHAHNKVDKLSDRITSLVPDFIQDEAPVFEQFLKAYYEFLEAEVLTLSSQGDIDGIQLEDDTGSLLVEPATVSPSPDQDESKLLIAQTNSPFAIGEYIVGSKTGTVAKIHTINGLTFYTETISGKGFDSGETVTSRQGGQTGVVKTFKHNTVLASNSLLNYSDVDQTTEQFLDYFQRDFIPSLDLDESKDARLTIKNVHDLYQKKGTKESVQFLLRLLYGQDAEIRYLIDETIKVSESGHNHQRKVAVVMDDINTLPTATDKIVQYEVDGKTILAESIVENVYIINTPRAEYSIEITDNHFGEFVEEYPVTFVDRDGVTKVTGRCKGILSDIDTTRSSIYVAKEDGDSLLLEAPQLTGGLNTTSGSKEVVGSTTKFLREVKVGDVLKFKSGSTTYSITVATIVNDTNLTIETAATVTAEDVDYFNDSISGGVLNEHQSFGSMYNLNDPLVFTGGKADRDTVLAKGVIDGLRRGGVEKVYVEDGGTGYNGGDIVVFDNSEADGSAAEAVIGAVEDTVILENRSEWGQFEITATAGQTLFNGTDNNGRLILFNDNMVQVFVDGVKKVEYTDYTFKNDRVTFETAMSGGELIEIYTQFNQLLLEDGDRIQLSTTESHIRSVTITSQGTGYSKLPRAFPGGYIYLDPADISGYQVGETITGGTSSATATIIRKEEKDGRSRLVVKRTHTDVNQFVSGGEIITGNTSGTQKTAKQIKVSSGTGAKLVAYSDEIGGVGSVNIQEQGYNFKENQSVDSTSHFKMLITSPTGALTQNLTFTGRITGATAKVVNHDADRQILTFTDLDGHFLDNEQILFNNTDTFKCLKFNPYQARGKLGAEGIVSRQLVTNESTLDEDTSNLHDGLFYQTHSYIIKIGESINKYRAIVKDLVHPSGHIFFGEVAVKNFVNPFDPINNAQNVESETRFNFNPTIIIKGTPTYYLEMENASRDNYQTTAERDDQSHILLENGSEMVLESAPDFGNAITEYLKNLLVYSTQDHLFRTEDGDLIENEDGTGYFSLADRLANDSLLIYEPTELGTSYPHLPVKFDTTLPAQEGHVNIRQIKSFAEAKVNTPLRLETYERAQSIDVAVVNNGSQNVYKINDLQNKTLKLEEGFTYYFSQNNNSHPFKISTTEDGVHNGGSEYSTDTTEDTYLLIFTPNSSTPRTLYYYCNHHSGMGGVIHIGTNNRSTSLSIDNVNNPSHSPYERRGTLYRDATQGIIMPSYIPFDEEAIVLEDGFSKIIVEEETHHLREESDLGDGLGARFITEDGEPMKLEDGSYTVQDTVYMSTERVQTFANFYHIDENGNQFILEDGGVILDERTQGESLTSFAPIGTTIGDLNKMYSQQVYEISYYLLDEDVTTDALEDRIVLEDGHGSVLLETSKESGMTFEDYDSQLPNFRLKSFDEKFLKRTNITWNAYVTSSNIRQTELNLL